MGLLNTTKGKFTAPDTSEQPDISAWLLDLAQQVEDAIGYNGWVDVTGSTSAASGWTVGAARYRRQLGGLFLYLSVTCASAITAGGDGNITNQDVCTLPVPIRPSYASQGLNVAAAGPDAVFVVSTSGVLQLAALANSTGTNTTWSLTGMVIV